MKAPGAALALLLSACASVTLEHAPALSPFGDGTQWVVLEDMPFQVRLDDGSSGTLLVPRGFVTDLASTPPAIWSLYPPFGKYLTAAILHDYLYWRGTCTQAQADKIIYQSMRDAGVDQAAQSRFYVALRAAGEEAWKRNDAERSRGLIRVLPDAYLKRSAATDWPGYRDALRKQGVREPPAPGDDNLPGLCAALGNEIKVDSRFAAVMFGR